MCNKLAFKIVNRELKCKCGGTFIPMGYSTDGNVVMNCDSCEEQIEPMRRCDFLSGSIKEK